MRQFSSKSRLYFVSWYSSDNIFLLTCKLTNIYTVNNQRNDHENIRKSIQQEK